MAENAGQNFMKEVRLKLNRLIPISPRLMGDKEQMMGCFMRRACIYVICNGKKWSNLGKRHVGKRKGIVKYE